MKLRLPEKFTGKVEEWEECWWQVKSYISLFHPEVTEVMDSAEIAAATVTDEKLIVIEQSEEAINGLVATSRQLHYFLSQTTTDSARLLVRGNTDLNGFETWRLLTQRFALPGTAQNISLLTKVLEFRCRTEQFEQDYSEWETLKNRYERHTGRTLPDSVLVATLLNQTSGPLQPDLRLNVRTLDTYENVKLVILTYYQLRHVTGLGTNNGPAPMDVGALTKGKGRVGQYHLGHWKGQGKGKGRVGICPLD